MVSGGRKPSALLSGLPYVPRGRLVRVRGGQRGPGVRNHSGARVFHVEAVLQRGWRSSFAERERSRQGGVVAASMVDGSVRETLALCRES